MVSNLPILAVLAVWARHGLGATCGSPLALPITDVQVVPSIPNSFMKGIPTKIGTPPQDIVLLPWALVLLYPINYVCESGMDMTDIDWRWPSGPQRIK